MKIPSFSKKKIIASLISAVACLVIFVFFGEDYSQKVTVPEIKRNIVTVVPPPGMYRVMKVVDGDTIQVSATGTLDDVETVRFIGINTPETVDPRKEVECFGHEASSKTKSLLTDKNVFLERDTTQADRDKYGRLLRYVILEDKTNVNQYLIQEGYAYEYTYKGTYKYRTVFKEAQVYAEEHKKGLWADETCAGKK